MFSRITHVGDFDCRSVHLSTHAGLVAGALFRATQLVDSDMRMSRRGTISVSLRVGNEIGVGGKFNGQERTRGIASEQGFFWFREGERVRIEVEDMSRRRRS